MIIDINVHLGIKLYPPSTLPEVDAFILNPSYKYGCDCCVDGFYQQYLTFKEYPRFGIYNVKCRISPEVELYRQIEKGIRGVILNPINHSYSLLDDRVGNIIKILEKEDLPLLLYTGKGYGNPAHVKKFISRVPYVILIHSGYPDYVKEALELLREDKVYFETSLVPPNISLLFEGKRIFGSEYPYIKLNFRERIEELRLDSNEKYGYAKRIFRLSL